MSHAVLPARLGFGKPRQLLLFGGKALAFVEDHLLLAAFLDLVRVSDVAPKEVDWLWPRRIAQGKLTMSAWARAGRTAASPSRPAAFRATALRIRP